MQNKINFSGVAPDSHQGNLGSDCSLYVQLFLHMAHLLHHFAAVQHQFYCLSNIRSRCCFNHVSHLVVSIDVAIFVFSMDLVLSYFIQKLSTCMISTAIAHMKPFFFATTLGKLDHKSSFKHVITFYSCLD